MKNKKKFAALVIFVVAFCLVGFGGFVCWFGMAAALVFVGLVSLLGFTRGFVVAILEEKSKEKAEKVEKIWKMVNSIGFWFIYVGILYFVLGKSFSEVKILLLIPLAVALAALVSWLTKRK